MLKLKLTRALKVVFSSPYSGKQVFADVHKYLTFQGVPRSLRGARLGLRKRMHLYDEMFPDEVKTGGV